MKANWSKILIAVMALFILFIVTMGIIMATSSQTLYEDNYYEQGELHAERMEQEQAGEQVVVTYNHATNSLDVTYGERGFVVGYKLIFLADDHYDMAMKSANRVPKSSESLKIPKALKEGLWMLEMVGMAEGKTIFKKQQFVK